MDPIKSCNILGKSNAKEAVNFANDVIEGKFNIAKRENEFIYHDKVPDDFWVRFEYLIKARTDQVWIQCFGILRLGHETDQGTNYNSPQARYCCIPHVRYLINGYMRKFIPEINWIV